MRCHFRMRWFTLLAAVALASKGHGACCYFSAKNADILQPAQKVFLTYDPAEKLETFTVQPKFEGNALDFGMVIPTPTQPKLHEMPKEFFKHLAVYTILKKREKPYSKLLFDFSMLSNDYGNYIIYKGQRLAEVGFPGIHLPRETIGILEVGVVGTLDYKIITAESASDLHQWLKDNKYNFNGDEATLDYYIKKKWCFTVMKIDTAAMKKNKDGTFAGEVTPTRFQQGGRNDVPQLFSQLAQ